jgi:hypothetical protein
VLAGLSILHVLHNLSASFFLTKLHELIRRSVWIGESWINLFALFDNDFKCALNVPHVFAYREDDVSNDANKKMNSGYEIVPF